MAGEITRIGHLVSQVVSMNGKAEYIDNGLYRWDEGKKDFFLVKKPDDPKPYIRYVPVYQEVFESLKKVQKGSSQDGFHREPFTVIVSALLSDAFKQGDIYKRIHLYVLKRFRRRTK